MKCSTSLWSADLANLATEIKRVEPYSDRFHIDVADGHYVHSLLFFPDLVNCMRLHSALPFEIHLTVSDPLSWVEPFTAAGADIVIFCLNSHRNPFEVIKEIEMRGKRSGMSLPLTEPVDKFEPYLDRLDTATIMATNMGIKGAEMDSSIPDKVRRLRQLVSERGLTTQIEVDGGIRKSSVPLIQEAGADFIVPGSLMFSDNPRTMRGWLDSL